MRIGVDATSVANSRGYGRHARGLLGALLRSDSDNRYVFVSDAPESLDFLPADCEVRIVEAGAPTSLAASARGRRSFADMLRMSRALSDSSFDILFIPTVYSYVPVFSRARKIITIHDVIAETFPKLTVPDPASRLYWKTKVWLGRMQADAIVTVSDYSRDRLIEHFGIPDERVFTVGEAGDPVFRPIERPHPTVRLRELSIAGDQRFIVYVGGFNPHKNLETLVTAFAEVSSDKSLADLKLVMVGEYRRDVFHSYFDSIKSLVENMRVSDRVIFTGYLPDEDLTVLLNLGTVLVLPSLMEGFGLPAIEAAACGCPVIATTASPLPELLGRGGIYFDPVDKAALVAALRRVIGSGDLRDEMRVAGLASARALTWDAAADQMIDVIKKVGAR